MRRDVRVFLDDIVEACGKINRYTSEFSLEHFREDEKTIDAVVRNLEVIGEAAKKLPEETRRDIDVDWKRIAGLRDVLIHEYFRDPADRWAEPEHARRQASLAPRFFR